MASSEQVTRLLALVSWLHANPETDVTTTAAQFGVTKEQLIADLWVLVFCGLPGGLPDDLIEIDMDQVEETGEIRIHNAEYLSHPMRFTPDEATSLLVALRAIGELAGDSLVVESAVAKLAEATGTIPEVSKLEFASGDDQIRAELVAAIDARNLVDLEYTDVGFAISHPRVAPQRLLSRDGYGYLQGWNLEKAAWRTYRLDRIDSVTVVIGPFPELDEPPAFDRGWLENNPEAAVVTLTLRPDASWVAESHPVREVRRHDDHLEVDLIVADPAWLRSLLLTLGPAVIRISPSQAGDGARELAAEALAAYQEV